ncbi:MAG TPA: tetratricopeptide repeat protein [Verrucomicrobiae bacterium]|nr:tetratricopeptide repeat protein [Verrucomicrobiae bacterium]
MLVRITLIAGMAALCAWGQDTPTAQTTQTPEDEIAPLLASGNADYLKGDFAKARDEYKQAWDLATKRPNEDQIRYDVLKRLSRAQAALGDYQEASDTMSMAISWREQTNGPADPKLPDDLLVSVGYLKALKDWNGALAVLNRVMTLHIRLQHDFDTIPVADDLSRMSQIFMSMDKRDTDNAIRVLNQALEIRTKLSGPLDPSLIYDLDRLGSIYNGTQAYDKAEETYRHALVIRESIFGKDDADLIPDVDGLAFALFGEEKYDDADPVYHRLVDLWALSTAPDHPMLAIAWQKLGVFYCAQKKFDQAKEAFDKGNAIRALFFSTGFAEQAGETLKYGDKAAVIALYQKALKPLDAPNPVYDKLKADILGMITDLSKKTNAEFRTPNQMTKDTPAKTDSPSAPPPKKTDPTKK